LEAEIQGMGSATAPDQLRGSVAAARASMGAARASAPPEVAGDFGVVADGYGQLFDGMEQANYELSRVPLSAVQALATPEFRGASDRVQAYVGRACG
jgi:hypothetical protein